MSKLLKVAAGLVALVSLAFPAFAEDARKADGDTSAAKLKVYYDTNTVYAQDACVNLTIVALKDDGSVANNADAQGTILRAVVETTLGVVDANTTALVEKGYGGAKVKAGSSSQGLGGAYAKAKTTGVENSAMIQSMVNHKANAAATNFYKSARNAGTSISAGGTDTTVFGELSKTAVVAIESGIGAVAVNYPTFEGTASKTDTITVRLQKRYTTQYSGASVDEIVSKSDITVTVNPPKYTAKGFALVDTNGGATNAYYVVTSDTDPYIKTLKTPGTTTDLKLTAGYGKGYIQALAVSTAPTTAASKIKDLNSGSNQGTFVGTVTATFSYDKSDATKIYNTDATATADKTKTGEMTYMGNNDYVAKIELDEGTFTAAGNWKISLSATVNGTVVTTSDCGTITVLARPHSTDKPWKVTTKVDRPVVAKCTGTVPARPNLLVDVTDNYGNQLRVATLGSGAGPLADYVANLFATGDTTLNLTFKKDASNTTATAVNLTDIATLPVATPVTLNLTTESTLEWTTAVDAGQSANEKAISCSDVGSGASLVTTATVATVVLHGEGTGTDTGANGAADANQGTGHGQANGGFANTAGNKDIVGSGYTSIYGVAAYTNTLKVGTDDVVDYKPTGWVVLDAATVTALPKASLKLGAGNTGAGASTVTAGDIMILKNASGTKIVIEAAAAETYSAATAGSGAYLLNLATAGYANTDLFTAAVKAAEGMAMKKSNGTAWVADTAKLSDFFTTTNNAVGVTDCDDYLTMNWTTAYATATGVASMCDNTATSTGLGAAKLAVTGGKAGGLVYLANERKEISAPANVVDAAVSDKPFVNGKPMTIEVYNAANVYQYTMTSTTTGYSVANNATLVADTGILRNLIFQKAIGIGDYAIIYPTDKTYGATKLVLRDTADGVDLTTAGRAAILNGEETSSYYVSLGTRVNLNTLYAVSDVDATVSAIKATVTNGTIPCVEFTPVTAKDGTGATVVNANLTNTGLYGGTAVTITVTTTYGNKVQISNDYAAWADQSGAITLGTGNAGGIDPAKLRIRVTYEDASDIGKSDTITLTYASLIDPSKVTDTYTVNVTSVENKLANILVTGQNTCPVNGELLLKLKGTTSTGTVVATDSTASLANQIIINTMPTAGRLFDNCRGISAYGGVEYYQNSIVGMEITNSNDGIRFLTYKAPATAGAYNIKFTNGAGALPYTFPITVTATTTDATTLADGTGTDSSPVVSVTAAGSATTVNMAATLQLTAAITNYTGTETYNWTSSNTSVATVNGNGLVTGVTAGTVKITAAGANSGKSGEITLTVVDPNAATVTITPATATLAIGASTTLVATTMTGTTPSTELYTWTSSDDTVAGVLSNGVVTALKAGTAKIKATGKTSAAFAEATITVTAATVAVTPATATVVAGETVTLAAATTGATDASYTWTSSDTAVATVANGVVTGVAAGTATITAKGATSNAQGTATITVTAAPVSTTTNLYCPLVFKLGGAGNASVVVNVANIGTVDVTDLTVTLVSGGTKTGGSLAAGKSTQIDLTTISSLVDFDGFTLSYKSTSAAEIIAEAQSTLIPFNMSFATPVQAAVSTSTASSFWLSGEGFLGIGYIFNPGTTTATYNVTVAGAASQTVTVDAGKIGMFSGDGIGAVRIEPASGATYVASSVVTNLAGIMAPFTFDAGSTTLKGGMTSAADLVSVGAATSAATTANSVSLGSAGMNFVAATGSVTADAAVVATQLHFVDGAVAALPMSSSATVAGATFVSGMKLVIYNAGTASANLTITLYGATATDSKTVTVPAGASVEKTVTSTTVAKGAWVISGADDIYATGYGVANDTLYTSAGQ